MPKEALKKAEGELKKLKLMSPMSAEATVVRNYIDVLTGLPWSKKTKIKHDLGNAESVLNEDHYGLDKVKDRILEYLAVQQRVDKVKAPILCLVGPPGVGKTSLGSRLPRPPGASTCAWRWAACATRPRFAATAAPTSAPCRARCCRA
jgi:ATP-dependent Lon protease